MRERVELIFFFVSSRRAAASLAFKASLQSALPSP